MSPIDNSNIDFGYKFVKREEMQKCFSSLVNRFLEWSFQRTKDRLWRERK